MKKSASKISHFSSMLHKLPPPNTREKTLNPAECDCIPVERFYHFTQFSRNFVWVLKYTLMRCCAAV